MIKLSKTLSCKARLLPLAGAILLAGCSSLAPEYTRTELPLANDWQETLSVSAQGLSDEQAANVPWQTFIIDPRLVELIETALNSNRSLRQTLADVDAARATYRIQRADLYPQFDASLSGDRSKSSNEISSTYSAEAGLSSYEIDLYGKNQDLTEAELEAYLSTAETARATKISLIGEIASAWLTLAADRNALTLANDSLASAQKSMDISQKRLRLGVDSKVDLANAETVFHSARSTSVLYETQVAQDINALRLLVGEPLKDDWLPSALADSAALVSDVPAGLSSSLLLQRPDVLAAEHDLKAANANISAARTAFFPTLSLTATGGLASAVLSDLFTGGASSIWTIAPTLSLPIFDAGSNEANLAYNEAQQRKTLAAYEYAIQTAFSEVADALARRATIQSQLDAETSLVAASSRAYELSYMRYQNGVDSLATALEAQRTLQTAQQSLLQTRLTELNNRITLYRVLGGGLAGDDIPNKNTST